MLSVSDSYWIIFVCCVVGLVYAFFNYVLISKIEIGHMTGDKQLLEE
jgi:hypothetical protein